MDAVSINRCILFCKHKYRLWFWSVCFIYSLNFYLAFQPYGIQDTEQSNINQQSKYKKQADETSEN